MALVDDDVAEVVLGVVASEERGVAVVVDAERLVGGDDHAGVLFGVAGGGFGGVGREVGGERAERLRAEFVAVAEEECAAQLPGFGEGAEDADGDPGFARAGGEREQDAVSAASDRFESGAAGGALVVARALAGVSPERFGVIGEQIERGDLAVGAEPAVAQFFPGGEFVERQRAARGVAAHVALVELLPVGREGERHVVQAGVALGLLQPLIRRGVFGFGFNDSDRLQRALRADVEQVVGAPPGAADVLGAEAQEGAGRLFAANPVFGPGSLAQSGIDQPGAGVGLVERHARQGRASAP